VENLPKLNERVVEDMIENSRNFPLAIEEKNELSVRERFDIFEMMDRCLELTIS
jgi:hypothetical protein